MTGSVFLSCWKASDETGGQVHISGELILPGDKSIAHRALLLASLSPGRCRLGNLPPGADVHSTLKGLRQCGISVDTDKAETTITGGSLRMPEGVLDCGNSATTARLLTGLLAGTGITATLDGDESLRRRPMQRIIDPLRLMGADLSGSSGRLPLQLRVAPLRGIEYLQEVASAQVKSTLLLAGLGAMGPTTVREPLPTRDHTELLLTYLEAKISSSGDAVTIWPLQSPLPTFSLELPADPSTAAPFITACALLPGSSLRVPGLLLNSTRVRFLEILEGMGLIVERGHQWRSGGEDVGDLQLEAPRDLKPFCITAWEVPALIDELPLLALAACRAQGVSRISGAGELRFKESDRLHAICQNLTRLGALIEELPDGLTVTGGAKLQGGRMTSAGDHRMVMAMRIAALIASGEVILDECASLAISCPDFDQRLRTLLH